MARSATQNLARLSAFFVDTRMQRWPVSGTALSIYNAGGWVDQRCTYVAIGPEGVAIHEHIPEANNRDSSQERIAAFADAPGVSAPAGLWPDEVYEGIPFLGEFPPGKKGRIIEAAQVTRNLCLAHAAAYRTIHSLQKDANVGWAQHHVVFKPRRPDSAVDRWLCNFIQRRFNDNFAQGIQSGRAPFPFNKFGQTLPEVKGTCDFVGACAWPWSTLPGSGSRFTFLKMECPTARTASVPGRLNPSSNRCRGSWRTESI